MNRNDADAFVELLARFDLAYPRSPIPAEAAAAVYFPVLADLPLEQVAAGVNRWLRSDRPFPPAPGELRAAALGSAEGRAALAWARVKRAVMAGLGFYRDLDFGDPAGCDKGRRSGHRHVEHGVRREHHPCLR